MRRDSKRAAGGASIRVGFPWWLRPFLGAVVALTLGRRIWISPEAGDREAVIRHEMVHVRQMAEHGIFSFLWKYGVHYMRNRRRGMGHHEAYLQIPFEVEALAAERAEPL